MIVPGKLSALVVDDNAYARAAASATLRKLGLSSIDEVDSAAAAVGSLLGQRYDVVLLDWYMPEMNGAELLRAVNERPEWDHVLRVVVSTDGSTARRVELSALKVRCCVEKPFRPEVVRDVLSELISSR